jgi:hypothetical protein
LKGGEEVVVKGHNTLTDGATVAVIDPNRPVQSDGPADRTNHSGKQRPNAPGSQRPAAGS